MNLANYQVTLLLWPFSLVLGFVILRRGKWIKNLVGEDGNPEWGTTKSMMLGSIENMQYIALMLGSVFVTGASKSRGFSRCK